MLQKSYSDSFLSTSSSKIIESNPFYADLSRLMQDERFREINQLYFNRWSDIEVFVLYIKLYNVIEMIIPKDSSKDNIIGIIHVLMSHTESRRKLISLFQQFKNDEASFSEIVTQYVQTQSRYLLLTEESHLNSKL